MSEHWLFTATPNNFEYLKERNFDSFGFTHKSRKVASEIKAGDKCVIYISKVKKLGVICQITSDPYAVDNEDYPLRVNTKPELILGDEALLDVNPLVPQFSFIKPKQKAISWGTAFQLTVRKISEEDFKLIESEMRKIALGQTSVSVSNTHTDKETQQREVTMHKELVEIMENIGKSLGMVVEREQKISEYRHDIVWKKRQFLPPSVVIEVCDSGSLEKDILSLEWASENLEATTILVIVKDNDFYQAKRRLPASSQIVVVKAESIKKLGELVQSDPSLLKAVFK